MDLGVSCSMVHASANANIFCSYACIILLLMIWMYCSMKHSLCFRWKGSSVQTANSFCNVKWSFALCLINFLYIVKWSIALCLVQFLYIVKSSPIFSLCSFYYAVCRKCIYKKLNDEDLDHCPVCKIDLGCTPVEKLRYYPRDLSLNYIFSCSTNGLLH